MNNSNEIHSRAHFVSSRVMYTPFFYFCDVAFVLNVKGLSVVRNMYDENFNISLENLNKFDYICNYENNE